MERGVEWKYKSMGWRLQGDCARYWNWSRWEEKQTHYVASSESPRKRSENNLNSFLHTLHEQSSTQDSLQDVCWEADSQRCWHHWGYMNIKFSSSTIFFPWRSFACKRVFFKFKRCFGIHKLQWKIFENKNPIFSLLRNLEALAMQMLFEPWSKFEYLCTFMALRGWIWRSDLEDL